ncbi:hypothetical protein ACFQL1_15920 [Halomicroarcula sp. GCM10025709]|uniref:hypothetical protein n=1 Tax=Haloarcula TaxID=2237 RepID=UPI0024C4440E|nr:hypothetical protein [Halomicroarcula sp. YJ-61-S]
MIQLAETTEQYLQHQREQQHNAGGSISTRSGIENRPEKQRRVSEAIQEHT